MKGSFAGQRPGASCQCHRQPAPNPGQSILTLWILLCVYCNCAGWALSAAHQLNGAGYTAAFVPALAVLLWQRRRLFPAGALGRAWRKLRRRFGRPFPLAFLVLALLALLGGALYAPNNYDALAYRTPRVLHWLAEGRWHWIHTDFNRLNTRGCGIEWLTAPVIASARTDRFLFVINVISFALLPGRVFSLLTRLGVPARAAWRWMWLLPTGYGYLLQAGSLGNDLFGALLALAAVELALRARLTGAIEVLWLSIFAAALMTAAKAFNLLLGLPWLVAAGPALLLLRQRPIRSALVLALAGCASLLPSMLLNIHFCGDWSGQILEHSAFGGVPAFRLAVNAVLLLLNHFTPTVFPWANAWNHWVEGVIPASLAAPLDRYFEPTAAKLALGEMPMEESAGLGFGLSVLLLLTVCARLVGSPRLWRSGLGTPGSQPIRPRHYLLVPLAAWAATAVLMARSGLACPARYLLPSYVLLLAPVLAWTAQRDLFRQQWWRLAAAGAFFLAAVLVVINPARPLWPALSTLRVLGADRASGGLLKRTWTVYSVYGRRADGFAPARALLPAEANPLGLITFDDPETSLWRPFGSRRVLHICSGDGPEKTKERGIKYVLLNASLVKSHDEMALERWLSQNDAQAVRQLSLDLRAGRGPSDWVLARLR